MLLVPYRDRMESLDSGFLAAASSALVVPPLSPNRSRSPGAAELVAAGVGVLAAELELTLEGKTRSQTKVLW